MNLFFSPPPWFGADTRGGKTGPFQSHPQFSRDDCEPVGHEGGSAVPTLRVLKYRGGGDIPTARQCSSCTLPQTPLAEIVPHTYCTLIFFTLFQV